jgi:phospholipid/cholesterol/gamma-HCH transport system permease protein
VPVDIQSSDEGGGRILLLSGTLDAEAAMALLKSATPAFRKGVPLTVDLSGVASADSAGAGALAECVAMARIRGSRFRAIGVKGQVREILDKIPAPLEAGRQVEASASFLARLGGTGFSVTGGTIAFLQLLADTAYWGLVAPFRRRFPPPGATSTQAIRIGVDALPIVGLISFLLGLIMAFQAAYQLRQFGANIFVANLVGVSMVRELGPLMSAIVVAGRSGSAIAAELGTMTVGEEIDALRTMGINEIRFLVVPRVFAITFTQPSLTLFSNAVGILGGFLIAILYLDLSAAAYLQQTINALSLNDLITGLSKSVVFAWIIVLIGCHTGLRITGGAEGVGRATTTSVVASIFFIIVADSVFTTLSTLL